MDVESLEKLLKNLGESTIEEDHIDSCSILMAMAVAAEEKAFNKLSSECGQSYLDSFICAPPSIDLMYGELRNFIESTLKNLYLFNETHLKNSRNPDWDFKIQSEILYLMLGARDILKNIINKNVTRLKAFAVHHQVPFPETKDSFKENDFESPSSSTIQNSDNDGTDSRLLEADKQSSSSLKESYENTQNILDSKSCPPTYSEIDDEYLEEDTKDHNTALSFREEMAKVNYFDESEGVDYKESVVAQVGQTFSVEFSARDESFHDRDSDEEQQTFEGSYHSTVQEPDVTGDKDREDAEVELSYSNSASRKSSNSCHSEKFDNEQSQLEFEESEESSSSELVEQPKKPLCEASTKFECSDVDVNSYSEDSSISSLKSDIMNELKDLAARLFSASRSYEEHRSNSDWECETTTKIGGNSERDYVKKKEGMAFMKKKKLRPKSRSLRKSSLNSKSANEKESSDDDDDNDTISTGQQERRRTRSMSDDPSQKPLPCSIRKTVKKYYKKKKTEMSCEGNSGALECEVTQSQKKVKKSKFSPNLPSSADEADTLTVTSGKKRKRLPFKSITKTKKLLQKVNGRRNIRVIMNESELHEQTRKAGEEEEARKKRIEERQALLDRVSQVEDTSDASVQKLVLDYDDEKKQELVAVDPNLLKILKPFQVSGVRFMWNACFESLEHIANGGGGGCILAHCMGLGKTLQVITLVHTLISHEDTKVDTVLVICPYNTVSNWKTEFDKWLKNSDKINCYNLHSEKKYKTRVSCLVQWASKGGVMIIGYELFRKLVDQGALIASMLLDPGPDLVVCDEGHVLKNDKSDISKAIMKIRTKRRIVLTGTPFQNSLNEYYCMIKFIKPNLLGNRREFQNRFINPITNGRYKDSKLEDVQLMRDQSYVLHRMLSGVLQRLDYTELKPFLEPKYEFAIFFRMSDLQSKLYQYYIEKRSRVGFAKALFSDYPKLRLLWTHPLVLRFSAIRNQKDKEKVGKEHDDEQIQSTNQWWDKLVLESDSNNLFLGKNLRDPSHDPKLISFFTILDKCQERKEKLLVFSSSLATLDMIEHFLRRKDTDICNDVVWKKGHDYLRLDGDTSHELRSKYCEIFNDPDNSRSRLFLISTRAGSLGINLTGANRVIIYDVSWNPAADCQSIFRVYRLGQKKPCYIYRFVAEGTMEEKIYERQITKLSVACRVVDEKQIQRHYLRKGIKELYTFKQKESTGIPHKLPDDHVLSALLEKYGDLIIKYEEHDALLENILEERLTEGERKAAWEKHENILFTQSQAHHETMPNSENQEHNTFADHSNISNQDNESLSARTSGEILPELVDEVNKTSTFEAVLISADETDASSSEICEADYDIIEDLLVSSSDDEYFQYYPGKHEKPCERRHSPVSNSEVIQDTNSENTNEKEFQTAECESRPNESEIALSINSEDTKPVVSSPCENNCAEKPQNLSLFLDLTNDSEGIEFEGCASLDSGKIATYCAKESGPTVQIENNEENFCANNIVFPVTDELQAENINQPDEVMKMDIKEGKAELLRSFLSKCQQNLDDMDFVENHDAFEEKNINETSDDSLKQVENVSIVDSINVPESSLVQDDPVRVSDKTTTNIKVETASFVKIEPADEEEKFEAEKIPLIADKAPSHSINTSDNECSVDNLLITSTPNGEEDYFIVLDAVEFPQEEKLSSIESKTNPNVTVDENKFIEKEDKEPLESRDGNGVTSSDTSNRRDRAVGEEVVKDGKSGCKLKLTNTSKKPIVKRSVTWASPLYSNVPRKLVFSRPFSDKKEEEVNRSLSERFSGRSHQKDFDETDMRSTFSWINENPYYDARPCRSARKEYWSKRLEPRKPTDQTWQNQRKRTFHSSAEERIDQKRTRVDYNKWESPQKTVANTIFRKVDQFFYQNPPPSLSIKLNWRESDPRTVYYKNHHNKESSYWNVNWNQNFPSPIKRKRYTQYHQSSNTGNFYSYNRQF